MNDNLYRIWSWNQHKMYRVINSAIIILIFQLACHTADAVFCAEICTCETGYTRCRQSNLTYIPQWLYRYTISLDVGENRIFSLPNNSFENVPDLEILNLDSNRISHIETNAFYNLQKLRILNIRNNRISSIPKDIFSTNRKLEILDLSQNELYYLQNEAVNYLFNLQVLNVSHNHISSAYLGINFRNTLRLQNLDLSHNNILKIEQENFLSMAFWETGKPHHLNLSHCNIRNIQRNAFQDLTPLTGLTLSDNHYLSIHSLTVAMRDLPVSNLETLNLANLSISSLGNMFKSSKFSRLRNLDLSRNFIERIPTGSLYTLENLQTLDLSRNFISQIQSLNGLNNLKILNLNENRLAQIDFSFDDLHTLQELHLANNLLTNLNGEPFENLWDLEVLDISYNSVSNVNIKFGFENIRYLYMTYNEITDISFLQRLPHLKILEANFNKIAFLSKDVFSRAQMLNSVNLSHNSISRIDPATFALSTLERLDLSYNRLEQLVHFGWKAPLKELYLHHNNITYIAPNSLEVNSLEILDISHCELYGFSLRTFADLRELTTLDVSHNNLGQFFSTPKAQSVLKGMERLKNLDVSHCELTEFPTFTDSSRKTLETIDLCCNEISKLSEGSLNGYDSLLSLNLANNQISVIESNSISDLMSLENIDLSNNPFSCSCDLKPLCDWFNSPEANMHGFPATKNAYSCRAKGGETFQLSRFCSTIIPQQCDAKMKNVLWIVLACVVLVTFFIITVLIFKYCHRKRKQKLKSRASQNMALQNSCKGESEKMMPDTCRYICDDVYKEDML